MSKQSIKINYILNTTYQILVLFVPLITTPYISRVLGVDGIGIYSYTYSIISYFVLISTMGTTTYGQRSIAYYQGDIENRSIKFFEVFIFRIITTIISSIMYICYLLFFVTDNKIVAVIQYLYLIANMFDITWFFIGIEDFRKVIIRNTIIKIFNIFLIFAFIKKETDIALYTFILVGMTLLGNISIWCYLPKNIIRVSWKKIRPFKHLREIISLFIPTIAIQVYTVLDKTMIGAFSIDAIENGYYEQTDKIVRMALAIVTSLGTVMVPRIAKVYAEKRTDLLQGYIEKSYKFVSFISIPIMFGLISIAPIFVPVFYGVGYDKIKILLPLYSMLVVAVGISNVSGCQYLIPTQKQKVYSITVSISASINLILNILLIPKYFSIGAAIASVLAEWVGAIIMLLYIQYNGVIKIKNLILFSLKYWISGICMMVIVGELAKKCSITAMSLINLIIIGASIYICMLLIMKDRFLLENMNIAINKLMNKKVNN